MRLAEREGNKTDCFIALLELKFGLAIIGDITYFANVDEPRRLPANALLDCSDNAAATEPRPRTKIWENVSKGGFTRSGWRHARRHG